MSPRSQIIYVLMQTCERLFKLRLKILYKNKNQRMNSDKCNGKRWVESGAQLDCDPTWALSFMRRGQTRRLDVELTQPGLTGQIPYFSRSTPAWKTTARNEGAE